MGERRKYCEQAFWCIGFNSLGRCRGSRRRSWLGRFPTPAPPTQSAERHRPDRSPSDPWTKRFKRTRRTLPVKLRRLRPRFLPPRRIYQTELEEYRTNPTSGDSDEFSEVESAAGGMTDVTPSIPSPDVTGERDDAESTMSTADSSSVSPAPEALLPDVDTGPDQQAIHQFSMSPLAEGPIAPDAGPSLPEVEQVIPPPGPNEVADAPPGEPSASQPAASIPPQEEN